MTGLYFIYNKEIKEIEEIVKKYNLPKETIEKIKELITEGATIIETEEPLQITTGYSDTTLATWEANYETIYGKIEEVTVNEYYSERPTELSRTIKIYTKTPISIIYYYEYSDYPEYEEKIIYIIKKKLEKTEEEMKAEEIVKKYNLPETLVQKIAEIIKEGNVSIIETNKPIELLTGYSDTTVVTWEANYTVLHGEVEEEIIDERYSERPTMYEKTVKIKPKTAIAVVYYKTESSNTAPDRTIYIISNK